MPERCFIRLYKKYNKLCPSDRPDDTFYLKPIDSPIGNQWYSRAPLGHNTLSEMVPQLCTKTGITGRKTNHLLRATCATRVYQEGVDEQLLMEKTGHRSVHGVRSYKRASSEQKKALSGVLNIGGNPESSSAVTILSQNNLKLTASEAIKGFTFNNCTDIYISIHSDHS